MSRASTEIPRDSRSKRNLLDFGSHAAYIFETNAEKQSKLFGMIREIIYSGVSSILYIAGKQGVKGIRLSLKDVGVDVSFYEKTKQLRIVDSEEFFTTLGRQQSFRPLTDIERELKARSADAMAAGFSYLAVVSETDMLVRKGYYPKYRELDEFLSNNMRELKCAFVCAFDRRELLAARIVDPEIEIASVHSLILQN
jgi:hypothetical protein